MKVTATEHFALIPEWVLYGNISSAAVRVYCVLHRYANSDGRCHPSRKSIASKARIGLSTVDRSIDELIALGALTVRHRTSDSGDPTSNEYTIIVNRPLFTENRPHIEFEQRGLFKSDNQTKAIVNQSQEPSISSSLDDGFDEFWSNYPRKVAKKAALKAWRTARKEAQKEDIIAGVILYAIMRRDEDPRFTPHASTWLNQGRWADETMIDRPEPETPKPIIPAWEPCGNCHGGWVYATDDRGYEVAQPCICRP